MLSTRQRVLALATAAVGVLAWWLHPGEETLDPREGDRERRPDYRVNDFNNTMMNELGAPHRHLIADELRHYPDDDSKELDNPYLTLYVKIGPPWLVRSETAWISGDDNLIRMHGEVHIDREAGVTTQPVHLKTRELLLKQDQNYAQTDQPVWITSEDDWTTADKGAEVWLEEELRVKLWGRVRGEMISPPGADKKTRPEGPNDRPRKSQ